MISLKTIGHRAHGGELAALITQGFGCGEEELADAAAVKKSAASLIPFFAKAHRADFAFGSELIQGAPGEAKELAAGMMVSELWHGGNVGRLDDL